MAGRTRSRAPVAGLTTALLASLLVVATPSPAAAAPPTPTPPRTGNPTSIAVIGDSISTATGTGELGAEVKANSWVTGNAAWSMRGLLGISSGNAHNVAANGRRINDFDNQALSLPTSTQYVVVELGGNDLCRPSVAEMTSEASYRNEVRNGLAALRSRVPDALIFLAGIPDIYNLWYLRGAPSSVNPYVADETDQASQARLYWDNGLIDIIPCKSLLENPTSTSAGDEARRQQVRARNQAFNQILREECDLVLRCRHDTNFFFDFSSNRSTPPNGPYLPRNQWQFTDRDISHNRGTWGFLCPVNFTYDQCGDHFHPSIFGQQKLATAGHTASYQWSTDSTAPTVGLNPARPPDGNARYASPVDVSVTGNDASGVRGYETRVHRPNGTTTPWTESIGSAPTITVSDVGQSYVEARALDQNGNLSSSTILGIHVDPSAFGTLAGVVRDDDGLPVSGVEVARHDVGILGALDTVTTGADGRYDFGPVLTGSYKLRFHDPGGVYEDEWHLDQTSHGSATPVAIGSQADVTVDAVLSPPPQGLVGEITDGVTGSPLHGVWVAALRHDNHSFVAGATTGPDGTYQLDLDPGAYEVYVIDPSGEHASEWFDDHPASSQGDADAVIVSEDQLTTVDAALAPAGRTASITGTVTETGSGAPVSDAMVFAITTDGVPTGGDLADPAGDYAIEGLPAGSYYVVVADRSGDHLVEFHDDAPSLGTANAVAVDAGASEVVDAALTPTSGPVGGATLEGRLTEAGSGTPLEGSLAIALHAGTYAVAAAGVTDADGDYSIDLDGGDYRIEFIDPSFLHDMEWHADLPFDQIGNAAIVEVDPVGPTTVDAQLDPGGPSAAIGGSVDAPPGTPAAGAWVMAIGPGGAVAGGAVVDAAGSYLIDGLVEADYLLVFIDPGGQHAPEFHDDVPSPLGATPVTAVPGQVATVDATLAPPP